MCQVPDGDEINDETQNEAPPNSKSEQQSNGCSILIPTSNAFVTFQWVIA
jgi:hypothetical protein